MPQPNLGLTGLSPVDWHAIEAEHTRLDQLLRDLCDTCDDLNHHPDCHCCSSEKVASCRGRLPSFFYDFVDLISEHFDNEERIMGNLPQSAEFGEYLRQHREEHAALMREVKQLINQSTKLSQQGNVGEAIRQFHQLVDRRFSDHAHKFDNLLLKPELRVMN